MRSVFRLLLFAALVVGFADGALSQEKRFALLIGNQSYAPAVGVLKNPHNDIRLVASKLKSQGFEVLPLVEDAGRSAILGAVRELTRRLRVAGPSAIGFFYYSGHGAAEKDTNTNYLIPVDAKDPGAASFWDDSVKLDDVLRLLDTAQGAVKFVVFDACRNELQMPTRDTSKGLLPIAEQQGLFVAFASAPGRTASDRGETSGPYAAALAQELGRGGLDHLNLFQNVKETVIASTGGAQHPWESNGLSRRVYLTGESTTPADLALWESVRTTADMAALQRYLARFPAGVFAATAKQMIERLNAEAAQKEAALRVEIERRAQEAKLASELKMALDDARKARAALSAAERERVAATAVADLAKDTAATALAERNAAAEREGELRKTQEKLQADLAAATPRPSAERNAEKAELERQLLTAAAEASAARDALAAAESKRKAAEVAAQDAQKASQEADKRDAAVSLAALAVPNAAAVLGPEELARKLQAELKRVGCYAGDVDGNWGSGSRNGLEAFFRMTGFALKETGPNTDALKAVVSQRSRVCPLQCASDEVESGGRCVAASRPAPTATSAPATTKQTAPAPVTATNKQANRPNALAHSMTFWPKNTLAKFQTVTANTPYGVLSCTSMGQNLRVCSWQ